MTKKTNMLTEEDVVELYHRAIYDMCTFNGEDFIQELKYQLDEFSEEYDVDPDMTVVKYIRYRDGVDPFDIISYRTGAHSNIHKCHQEYIDRYGCGIVHDTEVYTKRM